MSLASSRLRALAVTTVTAVAAGLLLLPTTSTADAAAAPAPAAADTGPLGVPSKDTVGGLLVENSFVSSVGWVKPGDTYPSRILLTNTGAAPVSGAQVVVTAPTGTRFTAAGGGATVSGDGGTVTWNPAAVDPTSTRTLVLESKASTLNQLPTVVWRDISSRATVTVGSASKTLTSHGPKVIPPGERYETARYGDRPVPRGAGRTTPTATTRTTHERTLDTVINDPAFPGSTFNLFQEMSLGQLYPEGTVPSDGIGDRRTSAYAAGFDFTPRAIPGDTCTGGLTYADTPGRPDRARRSTPSGSSTASTTCPATPPTTAPTQGGGAAIAGVGALQHRLRLRRPGKLVHDAAAITDPEIDYSDFDTDKDGVVDFFMAVFAGCGGNGASQLHASPGCDYADAPYDNVWPHSLVAGVLLHRPRDRAARLHHRRPAQGPRGPAALVHRRHLLAR